MEEVVLVLERLRNKKVRAEGAEAYLGKGMLWPKVITGNGEIQSIKKMYSFTGNKRCV